MTHVYLFFYHCVSLRLLQRSEPIRKYMSKQNILKKLRSITSNYIADANYKLQMGSGGVIFASYPRVGSNWLRNILTEIIYLKDSKKIPTPITPESHHEIAVIKFAQKKKIGKHSFHIYPSTKYTLKIVKTHSRYKNYFKRVLYLHRNIADTLVSYFHYKYRDLSIEEKEKLSIDDYCLAKCDDFILHLRGYFNAFRNGECVGIITSYEKMKTEPIGTVELICDFLNINVDKGIIKRCISDHDVDKYYKQNQKGRNKSFVRKGKIGTANQELKNITIEILNGKVDQLYDEFIYNKKGYYLDFYNY